MSQFRYTYILQRKSAYDWKFVGEFRTEKEAIAAMGRRKNGFRIMLRAVEKAPSAA